MKSNTLEKVTPLQLDEATLHAFKSEIRGRIVLAGDEDYDEHRKVYNGMIDKRPAMIVKCTDVADVIACVNFGKENSIRIAIRAGGHNAGGLGLCDDGLVIDLSSMKGIRFDLKAGTVRVEGGCLLRDLDHATQVFGKAVPTGILSTTGVAGLTLGGGIGHLSRAYGLTIDSMLEADVVLASGELVTASEQENSDLFWAIRGGGGNFGVVTSFLFRMQNAGEVYGGPMLWPIEESEELMKFYRDYILKAPVEEYCYFAFLTVPPVPAFPEHLHLKKMCGLVWCNLGKTEKASKAVQKFRDFRKPALDMVNPIPFAALQGMFDALYPPGLQWYWKADFVKELTDESIRENLKQANKMPTPHSCVHIYPINGVSHQKKNSDTAFSYRDANWAQVIVGVDPDPANNEKLSTWTRNYWDAIHPFSSGGAYINFLMEEGQERVQASYRDNYSKLQQVKRQYDPSNLFNVNQNIKP